MRGKLLKLLLAFGLAAAFASVTYAQSSTINVAGTSASSLNVVTVAQLPASGVVGQVFVVKNGTSSSDCTVGGGTTYVLCTWNGSAWTGLGGGGGGTVTSVSGTASQIASTGGATPVLSLTSPVVFPGNISGPAGWTVSSADTGTPTFTFGTNSVVLSQPFSIGTDNSVAGTLTLANGAANAHTIWASGATTTNTIKGFATVPTTGDLVSCTVASTTCTLTDAGVLAANVNTSASTLTSTALITGNGSRGIQTPSATSTLSAAGALQLAAGGSVGSADTGTPTFAFGTNSITVNQPLTVTGSGTITATAVPLSGVTGASAAATGTETGAGNVYRWTGVETANLTNPFVIENTNSTNNNTSGALVVNAAGTSTGAIGLTVNCVSGTTNHCMSMRSGSTVTTGVVSGGAENAFVQANGAATFASVATSGSGGPIILSPGSQSASTGTNVNIGNFTGGFFGASEATQNFAPANLGINTNNNGSTGPTNAKLAKFTSAPSTVTIFGTADCLTSLMPIGVNVANAGTTGGSMVRQTGVVSLVFDGATTAGDVVVCSQANAGQVRDVGTVEPPGVWVLGTVLSTNAGTGTYPVALWPHLGNGAISVVSTSPVTIGTAATDTKVQEITIPALTFNQTNKSFQVTIDGIYNSAASTPTIIEKLKLCTVSGCGSGTVVTLATSPASAATTTSTNKWGMVCTIGTVSTGSSGTVIGHCNFMWVLGASASTTPVFTTDTTTAASGAIDLTGQLFIDAVWQYSAGTTSTVTANVMRME